MPSALWRCWLGGRKGIWPIKTEWWGAGVVICLERGADLHMAQLMPLPLTFSCFSKIQIGFTFLVPAHLGSPGKRAVKRVCVCVCVCVRACARVRVCVCDASTDACGRRSYVAVRAWSCVVQWLARQSVSTAFCRQATVYQSLGGPAISQEAEVKIPVYLWQVFTCTMLC